MSNGNWKGRIYINTHSLITTLSFQYSSTIYLGYCVPKHSRESRVTIVTYDNMNRRRHSTMNNDRISSLPDSLISHILSFLPTKDVVSTSILSKRWKSLWPSITTLDFNDEAHAPSNYQRYMVFVQFVYKILVSRDFQPIKRFRLHCESEFTCSSNTNTWVNYALRHQVEHLDVTIYRILPMYLPSSIFTCSTIVVLKLKGRSLEVKDMSRVCLPSLKDLHLESILFPNSYSATRILFGCPRLEKLILKNILPYEGTSMVMYHHFRNEGYETRKPKLLISADVQYCNIFWDALENAAFLRFTLVRIIVPSKLIIIFLGYINLVKRSFWS